MKKHWLMLRWCRSKSGWPKRDTSRDLRQQYGAGMLFLSLICSHLRTAYAALAAESPHAKLLSKVLPPALLPLRKYSDRICDLIALKAGDVNAPWSKHYKTHWYLILLLKERIKPTDSTNSRYTFSFHYCNFLYANQ